MYIFTDDGIENTVHCLVLDANFQVRIDDCQTQHNSICTNGESLDVLTPTHTHAHAHAHTRTRTHTHTHAHTHTHS